MAVISVRVPEALKKEMEQVDIDWNEELRAMIKERLKLERRRQAIARIDAIRARIKPGFDMAKAIREDRDA